ncbi:hypothetical protein HXX76_001679 [Chlamydomonas incerta]|uniref:SET domain-containing protein n=1 Tax=Chlamydomonas incerta TaxID=51695 RepID=A0A835WCR0_CHLIN|nr:hypothetical protein HXX76_001679 [Chlamydomonas incerta]|eukprot:KAG2444943.1 hypothetical protein HXX76_001679 [Chlamydomonas incerta]
MSASFLLPQPDSVEEEGARAYYNEVVTALGGPNVEVRLSTEDGKGKGVFATKDIPEGETVFTEVPLVSLQHVENRGSALVCYRCLRFVGTVEQQIGHKLHCLVEELKATTAQPQQQGGGPDGGGADGGGGAGAAAPSGSVGAGAHAGGGDGNGDQEEDDGEHDSVDLEAALKAGERLEQVYSHVPPERIEALRSGAEKLPLSEDFQLPPPVPCRRRCGEVFCGQACEAAAWEQFHCLLCTAPAPAEAAQAAGGAGPSTSAASAAAAATGQEGEERREDGGGEEEGQEEVVHGVRVDRRALAAFVEHAKDTNEIFILAAQVLASTLIRAARALESGEAEAAVAAGSSAAAGPSTSSSSQQPQQQPSAAACRAALQAGWRPYVYGWKRVWWEAVAVPEDVDSEEEFREQLRALAADSLELLTAALHDSRFGPDLLTLEVFGSVVGLFELNNLGLSVGSPVEDFFLAVDEEEEGPDKAAMCKLTGPLLDALDAEYATPCEATAFLALQSCINHSCDPNCTAACDSGDRTATVLAQRDIAAGDEVTLAYIDVSLPYKRRQAELRDYGFVCKCERCTADLAAARARKAAGGGGKAAGGMGALRAKIGKRR